MLIYPQITWQIYTTSFECVEFVLKKKESEPQSKNFRSKHQLPIKTADKYST